MTLWIGSGFEGRASSFGCTWGSIWKKHEPRAFYAYPDDNPVTDSYTSRQRRNVSIVFLEKYQIFSNKFCVRYLISFFIFKIKCRSVGISATDDRWFTILGECLAESEVKLDDFPPEMFHKGISEYAEMDSSQKLKLLNYLCDEALGISYVIEIYSYIHTYIYIQGFTCCDKFSGWWGISLKTLNMLKRKRKQKKSWMQQKLG